MYAKLVIDITFLTIMVSTIQLHFDGFNFVSNALKEKK